MIEMFKSCRGDYKILPLLHSVGDGQNCLLQDDGIYLFIYFFLHNIGKCSDESNGFIAMGY